MGNAFSDGLFGLAAAIAAGGTPRDRGGDTSRQPLLPVASDPTPTSAPQQPQAPAAAPARPVRVPMTTDSPYAHAIAGAMSTDSLKTAHNALLQAWTTGKIGHHEYTAAASHVLPAHRRLQESEKMRAEQASMGSLAQHRDYIKRAQTPDELLDATRSLWHDATLTPEHRSVANRELNTQRSNVTNLHRQQNVAAQRQTVNLPKDRRPQFLPLYPTPKAQ